MARSADDHIAAIECDGGAEVGSGASLAGGVGLGETTFGRQAGHELPCGADAVEDEGPALVCVARIGLERITRRAVPIGSADHDAIDRRGRDCGDGCAELLTRLCLRRVEVGRAAHDVSRHREHLDPVVVRIADETEVTGERNRPAVSGRTREPDVVHPRVVQEVVEVNLARAVCADECLVAIDRNRAAELEIGGVGRCQDLLLLLPDAACTAAFEQIDGAIVRSGESVIAGSNRDAVQVDGSATRGQCKFDAATDHGTYVVDAAVDQTDRAVAITLLVLHRLTDRRQTARDFNSIQRRVDQQRIEGECGCGCRGIARGTDDDVVAVDVDGGTEIAAEVRTQSDVARLESSGFGPGTAVPFVDDHEAVSEVARICATCGGAGSDDQCLAIGAHGDRLTDFTNVEGRGWQGEQLLLGPRDLAIDDQAVELEFPAGDVGQLGTVDHQCNCDVGVQHREVGKTVHDQRFDVEERQRVAGDGDRASAGDGAAR